MRSQLQQEIEKIKMDKKENIHNEHNDHHENKKRSVAGWFKSLHRTTRIALVIALIASIGIVAYSASVLWNSATSTTSLTKDKFIEVSLSGAETSGSVRPGSTVSLAPVLTNNGDINTTALVKLTVPVVKGASAYDYEVSSSWSLVDEDPEAGVYVYGYGTSGELTVIAPGSSTDPLTESFTMKSSITGAEFNGMGSVDISIDGYLVESDAGSDPVSVWGMI